jgi:hypothetical protein
VKVYFKGKLVWSGEQLRLAMLWPQWPQYIPLNVDGKVLLIDKSELTVE